MEVCCKIELSGRLSRSWEEEGRKYRLEQRYNGAGFFFFFFIMFDVESGGEEVQHCLSRGKGSFRRLGNTGKQTKIPWSRVFCYLCGVGNKSLAPARRGEKPSYVEAAKVHFGRARDAVWLQFREMDSLECLKAHSLVGKWSGWENSFEDWDNFRR